MKEKAENLQSGSHKIMDEIKAVSHYMEVSGKKIEQMRPGANVNFFATHNLDGGYNLQVNGYTLVFQYSMPHVGSESNSFISMTTYSVAVNKDGRQVDKHGLPSSLLIKDHLLIYKQYQLYMQDEKLLWFEKDSEKGFSSVEIVGIWTNNLLEKSNS